MEKITGFPPIAAPDAKILILGSMPSVESLNQQQYYAHPRNSFWPIIQTLFGVEAKDLLNYTAQKQMLIDHKIALWDVLQSCHRPGSLDSSIARDSILTNDFESFFKNHNQIRTIFFNGGKAEELFKRHVKSKLPELFCDLETVRLPSTSPAMAMLNRQQKLERWKVILDPLLL